MGAPFGQIMPGVVCLYPPVDRRCRNPRDAQHLWRTPQVAPSALIESGTKIQYGTVRPTIIGERVWVMNDATISHDVHIGTDSEIGIGALVGGHVTIGERCRIYMGAIIRPHVKIGDDAVVGMGAVVTKDVPAGETWAGNPARRLEHKPELEVATAGLRGT